ncbi:MULTISPECIES: hypothetical protein [Pseudomonas]|uniref:Uncharacterized protein n=1 Tax=Pseudomonas gessardii TaxID=78544 RepID=A0A7Y1MVT6_9PSED|nr:MULTISPECIES: hypothetical protein [Pseudomonas]MBH3424131.1 hypothetical protein [Pseudomonas gessardii]MCF4982120.1 hypothetical protein [Pseudomonas gessardii]MCF4991961.1 hypothetical protein [Pseudomonas gessardii]MCF5087566.1 hypothetical protein [Pseudomonas gessardii]MCF5096991.1 hypothetical protein [Pseudomonas gessardii]
MTRIFIVLLVALYSQAVLAETHVIKAFLADPVEVVDEQGKLQREIARKDTPKQPIAVLQLNKALDLVQVELAGQKIWLDVGDLRIEPPLNVMELPCQQMPQSLASDTHNKSTLGYGAGCSQ